jgi:hypothetical protein
MRRRAPDEAAETDDGLIRAGEGGVTCGRSVTKSLYFDTTTANRMPFADWLPSMMVGNGLFFPMAAGPTPPRSQFNYP